MSERADVMLEIFVFWTETLECSVNTMVEYIHDLFEFCVVDYTELIRVSRVNGGNHEE